MKLRIKCELLGCCQEQNFPCCFRCGEDLYADFIEHGRLDTLFRLYWRVRDFVESFGPRKCAECGRKITGSGFQDYGDIYFCNEQCSSNWIPF